MKSTRRNRDRREKYERKAQTARQGHLQGNSDYAQRLRRRKELMREFGFHAITTRVQDNNVTKYTPLPCMVEFNQNGEIRC